MATILAPEPTKWAPHVCALHAPIDGVTTQEVFDVLVHVFGPHADLLRRSTVCILCTCKRTQGQCGTRGAQRTSVVNALLVILALASRNAAPDATTGVRLCAVWTAMFARHVALAGKDSRRFYQLARAVLRRHDYAAPVLKALLSAEHFHCARESIANIVPDDQLTPTLLSVALEAQGNLQPITVKQVPPRLLKKWLEMPCPCTKVPRPVYAKERAALAQRGAHQAPHLVKECGLAWNAQAGPSTPYRVGELYRLARSGFSEADGGTFGRHPSLCIFVDTAGANPWHFFTWAVRKVYTHRAKLLEEEPESDAIAAMCRRFGAMFTTLALEWPVTPPTQVFKNIGGSPSFEVAYRAMFKKLERGSGHLNMYTQFVEPPVWTAARHRHCSTPYRDMINVLCLCLNRLAHGVDDHKNHKHRGAQPLPPNVAELNRIEMFTPFLSPSEVRKAAWANSASDAKPVGSAGCYAVLHPGHLPATVEAVGSARCGTDDRLDSPAKRCRMLF
jgi:hypothetical protein